MPTLVDPSKEKPTAAIEPVEAHDHVEHPKGIIVDAAARGQAATEYETFTPWETIKMFKMSSAVCFAAAFSAATDGYRIA